MDAMDFSRPISHDHVVGVVGVGGGVRNGPRGRSLTCLIGGAHASTETAAAAAVKTSTTTELLTSTALVGAYSPHTPLLSVARTRHHRRKFSSAYTPEPRTVVKRTPLTAPRGRKRRHRRDRHRVKVSDKKLLITLCYCFSTRLHSL